MAEGRIGSWGLADGLDGIIDSMDMNRRKL